MHAGVCKWHGASVSNNGRWLSVSINRHQCVCARLNLLFCTHFCQFCVRRVASVLYLDNISRTQTQTKSKQASAKMKAKRRSAAVAAARGRPQPRSVQSSAVAAAQAAIVRARRCVPELIQLFENGLAKRSRVVFRRPLRPASPKDFGGFDEDEPLEFIVGPFEEVFEVHEHRAAARLDHVESAAVGTRTAATERIDVVYVGECGEWICVFYE